MDFSSGTYLGAGMVSVQKPPSRRRLCTLTGRIRITLYGTLQLWGDCEDLHIFSPH